MIRDCTDYALTKILNTGENRFIIPKYQREYSWNNSHWEDMFDDIVENQPGYFLGSIIVVNQSKNSNEGAEFSLIDGQQRITTLSLLLLSIYKELEKYKSNFGKSNEDEFQTLRKEIVFYDSNDETITRLTPQTHNKNLDDYNHLLYENGMIENKPYPVKYKQRRKIYKAFKFFQEKIKSFCKEEKLSDQNTTDKEILFKLLKKINQVVMVYIEVDSNQDAYMLFESLNNRGEPLSAIDLIRNTLIRYSETDNNVDKTYDTWNSILECLSDDYVVRERFFRQFYNAFRDELNQKFVKNNNQKYPLGYLATKSTMLNIYEKLIKDDYRDLLERLSKESKNYSIIINSNSDEEENNSILTEPLLNLGRIGGAPSHLLLLYLLSNKNELNLNDNKIKEIIEYLIKFFVRRNLTDYPNTRNLTKIFMDIIFEIKQSNDDADKIIKNMLKNVSSDDSIFKEKLSGPIYSTNSDTTRFLLCYYEDKFKTKETARDLWKRENNRFIWSIEHIFPEGENIPQEWIDMIAGGNAKLANQYLMEYTHIIGNLTISAYNSNLSNMGFVKKRDRQKDGSYIGYKNGLKLNEDLEKEETRTKEKIVNRSKKLIKWCLDYYKL